MQLTALPRPLAGFKGAASRGGGREGRGGEVDSDAQLEQDRRLAKASLESMIGILIRFGIFKVV